MGVGGRLHSRIDAELVVDVGDVTGRRRCDLVDYPADTGAGRAAASSVGAVASMIAPRQPHPEHLPSGDALEVDGRRTDGDVSDYCMVMPKATVANDVRK